MHPVSFMLRHPCNAQYFSNAGCSLIWQVSSVMHDAYIYDKESCWLSSLSSRPDLCIMSIHSIQITLSQYATYLFSPLLTIPKCVLPDYVSCLTVENMQTVEPWPSFWVKRPLFHGNLQVSHQVETTIKVCLRSISYLDMVLICAWTITKHLNNRCLLI